MKKFNLTFKFTMMFVAFTIVILAISSILSYINQTQIYRSQQEESIQYVANYLEKVVLIDGDDFLYAQRYLIDHYQEINIPLDFNEYTVNSAREKYETLFAEQYPKKVLGNDIQFEELSNEVKEAFATYNFVYYRLLFEQAAEAFNIAYAYYLVPTGEPEHMYWFLDGVREPKSEGSPYLLLLVDVLDPIEKHKCMWEAWDTGKRPSGFDTYDDSYTYGMTYAYYTPLFISGEKVGVIGVEVEIAKVNNAILFATIRQMLMIGFVIVLFMLILLWIIRSQYIRKLVMLRNVIEDYSQNKNVVVAEKLSKEVTNTDEISAIMGKFSDMIYELELYMKNLSKTMQDLQNTKQQAIELGELATKDSLTGIRNKTAYDKEVQKIEWEMASGKTDIGVAMIDLNFLKRINDTYGHDKGNLAIISLCKIACNIFEHSPVFRIGGDEFVVILREHDLTHIEELIEEFNSRLKKLQEDEALEYWEKTSAAIGYAIYNPQIDTVYENIFKRADNEMYKAKKAMKAVRE